MLQAKLWWRKDGLLVRIILRLNIECQVSAADVSRQEVSGGYSPLLEISDIVVFSNFSNFSHFYV